MYVACDSWFNASCENYLQYIDCPGDLLLNWKDKGYCNVFNLLQVCAHSEFSYKSISILTALFEDVDHVFILFIIQNLE